MEMIAKRVLKKAQVKAQCKVPSSKDRIRNPITSLSQTPHVQLQTCTAHHSYPFPNAMKPIYPFSFNYQPMLWNKRKISRWCAVMKALSSYLLPALHAALFLIPLPIH